MAMQHKPSCEILYSPMTFTTQLLVQTGTISERSVLVFSLLQVAHSIVWNEILERPASELNCALNKELEVATTTK